MALPVDTVVELQAAGSDNNGGGFSATGCTGSTNDYSQQTSAQHNDTDLACSDHVTFQVTSTATTFATDIAGNFMQITTTGTGGHFVVGWYHIIQRVDANTLKLDRDPTDGTDETAGTFYVGGCLQSPGQVGNLWANYAAADSNSMWRVWQKSDANYTLTNSVPNTSGGPVNLAAKAYGIRWDGYATTRGDYPTGNDRPYVLAGSQTYIKVFSISGSYDHKEQYLFGIRVSGSSKSGTTGFYDTGSYSVSHIVNCKAQYCETRGFDGPGHYRGCEAYQCYDGFYVSFAEACSANNCDNNGFKTYDSNYNRFVECVSYDNAGQGFYFKNYKSACHNCTAYNNAASGFKWNSYQMNWCYDCVSYGNADYGYEAAVGSSKDWGGLTFNCAAGGNFIDEWSITGGQQVGNITLTVNPFVDTSGSNRDLRPNNTAGGGALLRAASKVAPGQTAGRDIGALQHADPAGGGTNLIIRHRRVM